MIPARFIQIDMFPLTGSGKIDRHELFCRSLPIAEPDPLQDAPTTETEQQLARIWQRVFHRDRIGRDSHFFELGGDSLLAAVVAAHVHADSGIELPLRLVSDHPTLRDLALAMTNLPRTSPHQENGPPVSPLPRDEPLPMSFAQEWIWQECMTQSSADGWSTVQRHRLLGPLQTDLLVKGIGTIFQRHEILRTTFSLHGTQPKAIVHASIDPPLEVLDLSHEDDPSARANEIVRRQLRESPFDVRRLPLARFWLVKVGAEEHLLFRAIHHVIVDAWSWKIFFNELTQIYSSLRLGRPHALPPAPQYVDYAARQRATMDKDSLTFQRTVDWWEQQFHGHPRTLRLPFQRTRPDPHAHPSEGIREYPIPPAISARLEQLAIRMGVTPFSIRVAVLAAALAEIVHQREFAFGMYTTGRHRLDLQNTFGMFANLMTLRLRWEPKRSFLDWVRIVHETIAQAREHAELPYQVLCDALRQRGRSWPVIEAIITTTDRFVPSAVADLTFSPPERLVDQMPWGFSLSVVQYAGDRWRCEFDVGRYDPIKVDVFLRRCESLFDGLTARPTEPMSAIMRPDGVSLAQAIRDALRTEVFPGWFDVMRSFKSRSKGIARRSLAMLLPVRRTLSRSVGLFGQRRRHSNYG
jgi:acyl carrier protein